MRGVTHPLDAAVGLADHLGQGRASEVRELDGLEAGPQALDRVQLRRVGGQAFDHQPGPLAVQPGPHGTAAMGRQAVPQQGRLLTAEEAPQLRKDLDEAATERHRDQMVEKFRGVISPSLQFTESRRFDCFRARLL